MTWCQNIVKQARKCAKIGIIAISNTARSNIRSIFDTDHPLIKYPYMMTWCQNIVKQANRCAKIANQVILRVARLKITFVFDIDHPLIKYWYMMTLLPKMLNKFMVPRTLESLENLEITWNFKYDLETLETLEITWNFVLWAVKIICKPF